jgi:prevent-host-death family protein
MRRVEPDIDGCSHESYIATMNARRSVGTRELKNRLSYYLKLVRAGASLVVTDRGKPVAEIGPPPRDAGDFGPLWHAAAAKGSIRLPTKKGKFARSRPVRLKGGAKLSDAVLEDRR